MRLRITAASFLMSLLLVSGFAQGRSSPQIISIVQLMASPEKYDGKYVVVFGFLAIGQENNRLYLGKADYDNVLLTNSLWVEVSDEMLKNRTELNKKYVRIEGVFRLHSLGMPPDYAGGITEISRCRIWSDPKHPLSEKMLRLMH